MKIEQVIEYSNASQTLLYSTFCGMSMNIYKRGDKS